MQNFKFKQCKICSGTLYNNIKLGHNHLCPRLKIDWSLLSIFCIKKKNMQKQNYQQQQQQKKKVMCLANL